MDRGIRGAGGTWSAYVNVAYLPASQPNYLDGDLPPGAAYRYRIRACNLAGCSAGAPSPVFVIPTN